jgi:hypothetical protein
MIIFLHYLLDKSGNKYKIIGLQLDDKDEDKCITYEPGSRKNFDGEFHKWNVNMIISPYPFLVPKENNVTKLLSSMIQVYHNLS